MDQFQEASASSTFIGGILPLAMVVIAVVVVLALPAVRDSSSEHFKMFRGFFYGDEGKPSPLAPVVEEDPAAASEDDDDSGDVAGAPAPSSGLRASDMDEYDFDYSVFNVQPDQQG